MIFVLFDVVDLEVTPEKAKRLFVFSNWAKHITHTKNSTIQVLYPGLPVPTFTKRKNKLIKILFIGTWFERKGGHILLAVFRKRIKQFPNLRLTLIGDLPKNIVIGSDEPIFHSSFVSNSKIKSLYKTHDILVHIPPIIEGYGFVVTEAMSCGLAIIVSKVSALAEFIEHKKSGLVIEPGSESALDEALTLLIKDKSLRRKVSHNARQRFIAHFSVTAFSRRLRSIFDEVKMSF